jgi:hypothetical protein
MRKSTVRRAFSVALLTVLAFVTFSNAPVSAGQPTCLWRGQPLPLPAVTKCSPWARSIGIDHRAGTVEQGLSTTVWLEIYFPPANARAGEPLEEQDIYVDWLHFWKTPTEPLSGCKMKTWFSVDQYFGCAYRHPVNKQTPPISYEICVMDRDNNWKSYSATIDPNPSHLSEEPAAPVIAGPGHQGVSAPCGPV